MNQLSKKAALEVLEEIEDFLEERAGKDRRKAHDPSNEYSNPDKDRRSGIDRREEARKAREQQAREQQD